MRTEVGSKKQEFKAGDTVIVHVCFPHSTDRYSLGKLEEQSLNPDAKRWYVTYDYLDEDRHGSWFYESDLINIRSDLSGIFSDIVTEHGKRFQKWGEQDYPVSDPETVQTGNHPKWIAERLTSYYEVPSEEKAKALCHIAFEENVGTWFHVIIEELAECVAASGKPKEELRKELIQLASVVIGAIESLERNGK